MTALEPDSRRARNDRDGADGIAAVRTALMKRQAGLLAVRSLQAFAGFPGVRKALRGSRRRIGAKIEEEIARLPRMNARPQQMLNIGQGLAGLIPYELADRLVTLAERIGVDAACNRLDELLRSETLELRAELLVWGFGHLEGPTQLCEGVWLYPMERQEQLARWQEWTTLGDFARHRQQLAYLYTDFEMTPAFLPADDDYSPLDHPGQARIEQLYGLLCAVGLVGPTPLSLELTRIRFRDPDLHILGSPTSRGVATPETILRRPFEALPVTEAVRDTAASYLALPAARAAALSPLLQDFNRALRRASPLDRGLEAMTLLEKLFRPAAPGLSQSQRGEAVARLLPAYDNCLTDFAGLRSLRNRAAHGDRARRPEDEDHAERGLRLVAAVLRTRLEPNPPPLI